MDDRRSPRGSPLTTRSRARVVMVTLLVVCGAIAASTQAPPLTIVSTDPVGELATRADARQVRVVFSEPMVPLGAPPLTSPPSWVRITPATPGAFSWSGTRTLIFSADAEHPLPFATTFTVRIDASATSVTGQRLETPYTFTFNTPYLRIVAARQSRHGRDVAKPVVIALELNGAVQQDEVLRHVRVTLEPHEWTAPELSLAARQYLAATEPAGLAQFEQKVADVRRIASSRESVKVHLTDPARLERFFLSYAEERSGPRLVLLETDEAPAPGSWLRVTIDQGLSSMSPRDADRSVVLRLEPAFFVLAATCERACDPATPPGARFSSATSNALVHKALTLTDVTNAGAAMPVTGITGREQITTTSELGWPEDSTAMRGMRRWRLHVAADLRSADGQTLGYPWVAFTDTVHESSFLELGGWVVEAGTPPVVPVVARNVTALTQWVRRVPRSSLARESFLIDLFRAARVAPRPPQAIPEIRALPATIDTTAAHGIDVGSLLSGRATGLVRMSVDSRDTVAESFATRQLPVARRPRSALIQITNLGLTLKSGPDGSLALVTRLDTGVPVANARVSVVDTKDRTRWRGVTGRDGVAHIPALRVTEAESNPRGDFIVTAEKDGDIAYVGSTWREPGFTWIDLGLGQPYRKPQPFNASLFTDRRVYRQAEMVYTKVIVRRLTAAGLRPLAPGYAVTAVISGPGGELARRALRVNQWSSAEWSWPIPADAPLGSYSVAIYPRGLTREAENESLRASSTFSVAALRVPTVRVDVTLSSASSGRTVELEGRVDARFLSGDRLGPRPFVWSIVQRPVQHPPASVLERYPQERWAVGYEPGRGRDSTTGEATLADAGHADIRRPAAVRDYAMEYTLEADVDVLAGQHVAGKAATVVHPPMYIPLLEPRAFVAAGDGITTAVALVDLEGRAVPDVPVTVGLFRERTVAGEPTPEEIPSGSWTVLSGAAAAPLTIAVPGGGSYIVRATARDGSGRQTRTDMRFYASGPRADRRTDERVDLIAERQTWAPGERARLRFSSPWNSATALLTTERDGVRTHRTFAVTSATQIVEVPITRADIPNVFVSILLIKGRTSTDLAGDGSDPGRPDFRMASTELQVEDPAQRLQVQVSSDRSDYRPGDRARVDVRVMGSDGRPVRGEVTLWAVDAGVLLLKESALPDVRADMLTPEPLRVLTSDNRMRLLVTRIQAQRATVDRRAAARAVAAGAFDSTVDVRSARQLVGQLANLIGHVDPLRRDFRPVPFWLGSLQTDARGLASTAVTLPESLTSYRIRAVATDSSSRFGAGEREVRLTKPLTLRASFPRFLTAGDEAALPVIVGSDVTGDVDVALESTDTAVLQAGGAVTRRVHVTAGIAETVSFDVRARTGGTVRIRVRATGGGASDGFEVPLKVVVPTIVTTTAAFGDTAGQARERLVLPQGLQPGGGLHVNLASTALVGLSVAARSLADYPYGCAEQKASRALAFLMLARSGGAFAVPGVSGRDASRQAAQLLQGLRSHRCDEGGFSLWGGDCADTSVYLTAYVLHVMRAAGRTSLALPGARLDDALDYLTDTGIEPPARLHEWPAWAASRAYAARTLAEYGRRPGADVDRLLPAIDRLPVAALSHLADVLAASGDRGARYQMLVRRLLNALRVAGNTAYVEERNGAELGLLWQSDVTATAVVLEGLVRRQDGSPLTASLARWLVGARSNGHWQTTHEDALVLEALATYYRAADAGAPGMRAVVRSGRTPLGEVVLDGQSRASRTLDVPMARLQASTTGTEVPLAISRTGTGRLYYAIQLRTFSELPQDAEDRGVRVERQYERFAQGDGARMPATAFSVGDVVRVTVTATLRAEGRYVALTDRLPAGFEALDEQFDTTARALADEATDVEYADGDSPNAFVTWSGVFEHIEKYDDRVLAFASHLAPGRHRFSYLVRATTAGTFSAPGASMELMYAPDVAGRGLAATISIK